MEKGDAEASASARDPGLTKTAEKALFLREKNTERQCTSCVIRHRPTRVPDFYMFVLLHDLN